MDFILTPEPLKFLPARESQKFAGPSVQNFRSVHLSSYSPTRSTIGKRLSLPRLAHHTHIYIPGTQVNMAKSSKKEVAAAPAVAAKKNADKNAVEKSKKEGKKVASAPVSVKVSYNLVAYRLDQADAHS